MNREVKVHLLPVLFEPEDVRGGIAVIIDVLRASTTIVHALAHGAKAVIPTGKVDEARRIAADFLKGSVLLGGERDGLLIDGFDLDNNPFAYSPEVVADKTIVFTTSNGTKALLRASQADRILIGSFVNLQAVVYELLADERPIHLVCAGTCGTVTLEDVLCAGAICTVIAESIDDCNLKALDCTDDQTQLALDHYRYRVSRTGVSANEAILEAVRLGYGGRSCIKLGFDDQIKRAAHVDLFDIVPEYDKSTRTITIASPRQ